MRSIGLVLAVLMATGALAAPVAADEREEHWSYLGGADVFGACHEHLGGPCYNVTNLPACLQGACTYVHPGTEVALELDDASGLPVGAYFALVGSCRLDECGPFGLRTVSDGRFCGTTSATAPSGSIGLLVFVDGPVFGPLDCITHGSPGIGTTGTLTIAFDGA